MWEGMHEELYPSEHKEAAKNPQRAFAALAESLGKLGTTDFHATAVSIKLEQAWFLPAAEPRAAVLAGGADLMVHLRQPQRGKRPPAVISITTNVTAATTHA